MKKIRTSESIRLNWLDMRRWNRLERLNRKRERLDKYFGIEPEDYIIGTESYMNNYYEIEAQKEEQDERYYENYKDEEES